MSELKGASITAVGFIPGDVSACFKIALWSGDDDLPFYIQATGDLIENQWNIIQLDTPQKVDIARDLYAGYRLSTYMNYPISLDDGPAYDSLGNMARFEFKEPWTTLLNVNPWFDWNLNIKAYFERDGVPVEQYRLYRSLDNNDYEMIAETQELEYTDFISPVYNSACYKLKSIFYNGCVSDFSADTCIVLTSVDPGISEKEDHLKIYPNPASDVLFIESAEVIKSVNIFDSRGMTIEQLNNRTIEQPNGRSVEQAKDHLWVVPLAGLAPGLYFVRVETDSGVVGRKVVIR